MDHARGGEGDRPFERLTPETSTNVTGTTPDDAEWDTYCQMTYYADDCGTSD